VKTIDCEQGSPEWLQARAGRVTASRVADILAKVKTGESASRRDYRAQLVAEILTGLPQGDTYTSDAMRWGTEQEPMARAAYEIRAGVFVDTVGLVLHPTIDRGAASPDGLVGPSGLVEIKCPKTATHLDYIVTGVVPANYSTQIQWQLACTQRDWCDFVSYDPRLPDSYSLFVARVLRDEDKIKFMESEVKAFLSEVDSLVSSLRSRLDG
jgi:putative phage-type endonuclease